MRSSTLLGFALASLVLPFATAASEHNEQHAHLRSRKHMNRTVQRPEKRSYSDARFTYYEVGLGSCGQTNVPTDSIVALDSALYNGGSECGKSITISLNGKTTTATIMDECPGCPEGGLDFSEGLFEYFSDLGVGVLTGDWWYN